MQHTDVIIKHRRLQSFDHRLLPFRSLALLVKFYILSWMLLCNFLYIHFFFPTVCPFVLNYSLTSKEVAQALA